MLFPIASSVFGFIVLSTSEVGTGILRLNFTDALKESQKCYGLTGLTAIGVERSDRDPDNHYNGIVFSDDGQHFVLNAN